MAKKARTAKQKAATAKMIAANKRGGKSAKKKVAGAGIGRKRGKGTVVGYLDRKPGKLYYVTGNGAVVETTCKNKGCRKTKSKYKGPNKIRKSR